MAIGVSANAVTNGIAESGSWGEAQWLRERYGPRRRRLPLAVKRLR